jgi:hypothetical protein
MFVEQGEFHLQATKKNWDTLIAIATKGTYLKQNFADAFTDEQINLTIKQEQHYNHKKGDESIKRILKNNSLYQK